MSAAPQRDHVHVVSDDVFFPSNAGGRMEEIGSTRSISSLGVDLSLTMMQREDLDPADEQRNAQYLPEVTVLRRPSFAAATLRHPLLPYQLSSRLFEGWTPSFQTPPTVVVAHHEWTLPLARRIARSYGARLFMRSHNDEITYLRSLRDPAKRGARRLYFTAELTRAARTFGPEFYRGVDTVLTISDGDAAFYRSRGVAVQTVPPALGVEVRQPLTTPPSDPTIAFAGSMDMPYVVDGLLWFVENVLPEIAAAVPGVSFVIMGRRCPDALAARLQSSPFVRFLGEVPDTIPHLRAARIFVNPVFRGSGVNMKLGAPASLGLPVVTTSVGARGVGGLAVAFAVADDIPEFASACTRLLSDEGAWSSASERLRERVPEFSTTAVAESYRSALGLRYQESDEADARN